MKELSRIYSAVAPSATLAVDAKFKEMKAEGIPVVGFGAGEPDFDTPDFIKLAGIKAIVDGQTKYTPATGTADVKKAVAYRLKEDFDLDYDYSSIIVSSGAKACLHSLFATLLNPGDEVILPAPYWVSYSEQIRMVGAVPVIVLASAEQQFKITAQQLENAITDKTKAFVINNPCNPTGMIYSREELAALAEILNGVSKSYAMTGWRCGYVACGDKNVAKVLSNALSHSIGSIGTMNQAAMAAALRGPQDSVEEMRRVFEARRDYMVSRINSIDGVSCMMPDGAFYVMMNIEKLIGRTLGGRVIRTANDFSMAFLEKGLVAVVACDAFGIENYIRWTYATSMENIKEGLDRLEKFLAEG